MTITTTTQSLKNFKIEHVQDTSDDSYQYISITLPNGVLVQHKLTVEGLIVDVFDKHQAECLGTMSVFAEDLEPEPQISESSEIKMAASAAQGATLDEINRIFSNVQPPTDLYDVLKVSVDAVMPVKANKDLLSVCSVTIGFWREDGDFAVLATLNNKDGHLTHKHFAELVISTANFYRDSVDDLVLYEREDAPDYLDINREDDTLSLDFLKEYVTL
jgi:hypothetical protein